MPNFCECGSDMFICQRCGRDLCSKGCNLHLNDLSASEWIEGKGNVCRVCLSKLYYKNKQGSYVEVEHVKPVSLKGNPAYDLMM